MQHVGDGVPHLAGRLQHAMVVAAVEDPAGTAEDAADDPGHADPYRLHSAAESEAVLGLDDEVGVVALQRVVEDAEVVAAGIVRERAQGAFEGADEAGRSQRRNVAENAHRHVRRVPRLEGLTTAMPGARPRAARTVNGRERSESADGRM